MERKNRMIYILIVLFLLYIIGLIYELNRPE